MESVDLFITFFTSSPKTVTPIYNKVSPNLSKTAILLYFLYNSFFLLQVFVLYFYYFKLLCYIYMPIKLYSYQLKIDILQGHCTHDLSQYSKFERGLCNPYF